MGLLDRAKNSKQASTPAKKKATTWVVGGHGTEDVSKAVEELVHLEAQSKAIEAKMMLSKNVVKNFCEAKFVEDFASLGALPDTPMNVQNPEGLKVTYVVQDRSSQYKVKEDQLEALDQLFGADAAANLTFEEYTLSFNRVLLSIPEVYAAVDKALEKAVSKLVAEGVIQESEAGELVQADKKTAFRPHTLERLSEICGRDTVKMKQFLDVMGSSATRYVKP